MLIKIILLPREQNLGDCSLYIITEHKGFIEALESITDYKVMMFFLEENKKFYIELNTPLEECDKEISVCPFANWSDSNSFIELLIGNQKNISIPSVKELHIF